MDSILSLQQISKIFLDEGQSFRILDRISLEIAAGEFFVFLGPSGSGKSTLLRIMSGLDHDYQGHVKFEANIAPADMSFVFQQFALLPWLTVEDNIRLPLLDRNLSANEQTHRVERELARFGLGKFSHHYPHELSGGLKQRVGIARALVTNPKIIFMDEPFSELDSFTAAQLRHELLNIWQQQHPTIIMVTHLIEEAIQLADRIAVLTSRPAHIEHVVTNPLPRPRPRRSPNFYHLEDKLFALVRP